MPHFIAQLQRQRARQQRLVTASFRRQTRSSAHCRAADCSPGHRQPQRHRNIAGDQRGGRKWSSCRGSQARRLRCQRQSSGQPGQCAPSLGVQQQRCLQVFRMLAPSCSNPTRCQGKRQRKGCNRPHPTAHRRGRQARFNARQKDVLFLMLSAILPLLCARVGLRLVDIILMRVLSRAQSIARVHMPPPPNISALVLHSCIVMIITPPPSPSRQSRSLSVAAVFG